MGDYLNKYGARLAVAIVLVALASGLIMRDFAAGVTPAHDAAQSLSLPARSAATGVRDWLENIYGYMYRYDKVVEENAALHLRVAELENEIRKAKEAEMENEHYRELLGLRDKYSNFVLESAKIVDRGTSNWNTTLTISKGEESGIEPGDCVVDSAYNLVGQVIEAGGGWATVRSIIDTDMSVGVLVGESGSAAMLVGDFALMRMGMTKLTYMTAGAQVFERDVILTSGRGGAFPKNLVIGTVSAVHTEAGGQIEFATISPAVSPDSLTQVFVIKEFEIIE